MAGELNVEVVAADRKVWSGVATLVVAKTTEGEIGIMAGHEPVLGLLATGVVTVRTTDGETVRAAVDRGFLSVSENHVAVLAEVAQLADEIDTASVESELAAAGDDQAAGRWAQARLQVAGAK
ncbi:F0F1 ATP synthase subunit epsilon [Phytoactinopolyspora halotolerans]|uniref:ATP synthase epsilon chain n=1 Tax=Phytoactinopolyspora halotolerans TaxID=1981512 RepID=A0A6L9S535_9ACTN|nr:F0F1 ATP synthase subunit epsilon [Phytoactinopolyspora halotolerans]NEE00575.1 F0F1 ATP synthase subunit epsilon [Phytoactinopolyspora halotolerans]